jgi:hypothetical protein
LSPEAHRATDTDDRTMAGFDEREKEFEARYKHDQELQFKVKARRNKLLGLWAAERMGLSGVAAEAYARSVVEAEFDGGDRHVVEKVCADLKDKGQSCTPAQIQFELTHFAERAKQQIMQE